MEENICELHYYESDYFKNGGKSRPELFSEYEYRPGVFGYGIGHRIKKDDRNDLHYDWESFYDRTIPKILYLPDNHVFCCAAGAYICEKEPDGTLFEWGVDIKIDEVFIPEGYREVIIASPTLKKVHISCGVKKVQIEARSLDEIHIGMHVESINHLIESNPKKIYLDKHNPNFEYKDGMLFFNYSYPNRVRRVSMKVVFETIDGEAGNSIIGKCSNGGLAALLQ